MKRSELLERTRFINHGSRKILKLDFSCLDIAGVREIIAYGTRLVAQMPERSVLTLTDVTDANYDKEVAEALKEFTRHNKRRRRRHWPEEGHFSGCRHGVRPVQF